LATSALMTEQPNARTVRALAAAARATAAGPCPLILGDLSVVLLVRRPSLPVPLGLVQVFAAPLGQIGHWPPPMVESLLDARGVDGVLDRVRDVIELGALGAVAGPKRGLWTG